MKRQRPGWVWKKKEKQKLPNSYCPYLEKMPIPGTDPKEGLPSTPLAHRSDGQQELPVMVIQIVQNY
jgi:hypothetical protein